MNAPTPRWRQRLLTLREEWVVAPTLLAILVLGLYWRLAFTSNILVGYDLFTYFYPHQAYVAAAAAQGRLPLWNPYLFAGAPFLANIQTAVLYPLNLPVYFLPPPQATKVIILLHVWLAGCFTYAFARAGLGLRFPGALVAALAFAFSGFLSAQIGHVNQLSAAAWLPLILLGYELAWRRRSLTLAVAGGVALGLQLLAGHSQESYLSLIALLGYAGFAVLRGVGQQWPDGGWLAPPARAGLYLAVVLAVGVGLAAVQLLPTFELSREGIRQGGLPYREAISFSLPPWDLARALLPGYVTNPFSEFVGFVGMIPLALAALGVGGRWRRPYVLFFALLALGALVLALGGYNPIYPALYRRLPGLALFRVPARWLFLYTFSAAVLAGVGMECWLASRRDGQGVAAGRRWLSGGRWLLLPLALALAAGIGFSRPRPDVLALWAGAGLVALAILWLGPRLAGRRGMGAIVVGLVVVELFWAGGDLERNHVTLPAAYSSLRPAVAQVLADAGVFRVLSVTTALYEPGDAGDLRAMLAADLSPKAVNDLIVAHKYKEVLAPNLLLRYGIAGLDGYDGGVLPLRRYVEFKPALLESGGVRPLPSGQSSPNQPDALLREQLAGIPDSKLLGMLNVKYVIADRAYDLWRDGVYYDLGLARLVEPGAPVRWVDLPPLAATAVGIVSHLQGAAAIEDGTPVAEVILHLTDGSTTTTVLRAGVETAQGDYEGSVRHSRATVAQTFREKPPGFDYLAVLPLPEVTSLQGVEIRFLPPTGRLLVRALSLIDERTGANEPVVANEGFRLAHLGDVKVYENRDLLPRAFLVDRYTVADRPEQVVAALRADPQGRVVLDRAVPGLAAEGLEVARPNPGDGAPGTAEIESYAAERVVVRAALARPGLLVLTDSDYPGWEASVDGVRAEMRRANHQFRAVYLPAGEHRVEFVYRPRSFLLGLAVSAATVVLALGLVLARRRGELRSK